jgi:hypothetical protein
VDDLSSLSESELERAGWLVHNLLKQTCELLGNVAQEASDYIDPEICEDDLDLSLRRITMISNGLRHILAAHLTGTTNAGKKGLIYRLVNPSFLI